MIPNYGMQVQQPAYTDSGVLYSPYGQWNGASFTWNDEIRNHPNYLAAYKGEGVLALQNLNMGPYYPEDDIQLPALGFMNLIGATSNGNLLAAKARSIAQSRNTVGKCYGAVADAVDSVSGRFLYGSSAYMAADQLKNSGKYTEH